ncbi:MAG: serine hydroxymethyltransferase [Halobacteriales archaeon]|nr:serine hydroxymethyltransferase [Halobacteriales archaeon]
MPGAHARDADFVLEQVRQHTGWFARSLPMIASENVISPLARQMLVSDFHDRYAEGHPGKRYYQGCTYIDEVERRCNELARKLFRANQVDVRATSGTTANMAAFFALAQPGDTIAAINTAQGGHISHAKMGAVGLRGFNLVYYPFDEANMTIDAPLAAKLIRQEKPKACLVGNSLFLFPIDVRTISDAAHEVGARVMYDAAHVLGLIAGGQFQDPLREGADVMTGSTHKTLPGPQGGVVATDLPDTNEADQKFKKKLDSGVFPGTVSSHHLHHMAAKCVAFAEALDFGEAYAKQVIRNAQALAQGMHELGLKVLCEHRGFTQSHQVAVDVRAHGGGRHCAELLERCNVISNMNMIPGDQKATDPSGLRFGSQELTRLGMREGEMREVAGILHAAVAKGEAPDKVAARVSELRQRFQGVHYCYREGLPAHQLWEFLPVAR